jgi:hypothetical protein
MLVAMRLGVGAGVGDGEEWNDTVRGPGLYSGSGSRSGLDHHPRLAPPSYKQRIRVSIEIDTIGANWGMEFISTPTSRLSDEFDRLANNFTFMDE